MKCVVCLKLFSFFFIGFFLHSCQSRKTILPLSEHPSSWSPCFTEDQISSLNLVNINGFSIKEEKPWIALEFDPSEKTLFYEYNLCPQEGCKPDTEPEVLFGSRIYEPLLEEVYSLRVRSCVPGFCSSWATMMYRPQFFHEHFDDILWQNYRDKKKFFHEAAKESYSLLGASPETCFSGSPLAQDQKTLDQNGYVQVLKNQVRELETQLSQLRTDVEKNKKKSEKDSITKEVSQSETELQTKNLHDFLDKEFFQKKNKQKSNFEKSMIFIISGSIVSWAGLMAREVSANAARDARLKLEMILKNDNQMEFTDKEIKNALNSQDNLKNLWNKYKNQNARSYVFVTLSVAGLILTSFGQISISNQLGLKEEVSVFPRSDSLAEKFDILIDLAWELSQMEAKLTFLES